MSELTMLNDQESRMRLVERTDRSVFQLRAASAFLSLPGLRLFAPMSSFDENGDAYDLSGQGRTLTYNGNPLYSNFNLAPFIELDGAGDYLSRADEAGLDILGNETYVNAGNRGLTECGWFWFDSIDANDEYLISKQQAGVGGSYNLLRLGGSGTIRFEINGGGAGLRVDSSIAVLPSTWYFLAGSFDPGAAVNVWIGAVETTAVTAAATLNNTAFNLTIGGDSVGAAATLLDGRASLCGLYATLLIDTAITALFQQTRSGFGV